MDESREQWQWQEPGRAWKGVGIYHITLVVTNRKPLLGTLVVPNNNPEQAKVVRTELGRQIISTLARISEFYPEIRLLQYCLMPDHLHAILHVTKSMPKGIMTAVRGFWQGAKKIGRKHSIALSSISPNNIRADERNYTTENDSLPHPIFTEMPFVRPLSRRGQLQAMIRYVQMNPQRLATKRIFPNLFRVQRNVEIAGRLYDAVGNIALLQEECYATVHVRRKMVEEAEHGETEHLRNYLNDCILAARKGTVMVSPFISQKEKEVLAVLLKEQKNVILLSDHSFDKYYKPSERLFDAVAAWRLLILSPWQKQPSTQRITRAECIELNEMAKEIAQI